MEKEVGAVEESPVVLPLFGFLDVTGEVVTMILIVVFTAVVSLLARRLLRERPGKVQNVLEMAVESLEGFFAGLLGPEKARRHFGYLGALFVFIVLCNYSGLMPGVGVFDWLKAPSASLSVTAALGVATFLFLQAAALLSGVGDYFRRFVSPMFFMLPLVLLDEVIKPVSLSLRLYGNIFGEEMVVRQLYGIFPVGPPILMMALSLLFCALQAVVYTLLVSLYLDEATEPLEPRPRKQRKTKTLAQSLEGGLK